MRKEAEIIIASNTIISVKCIIIIIMNKNINLYTFMFVFIDRMIRVSLKGTTVISTKSKTDAWFKRMNRDKKKTVIGVKI